eukprot:TRINITY_DN2130_c0_g2_i1.p1 TRINITY_DN2130_c0_g2~~TRINITY_DN2130_c0_g2_i1.p1  ORF type:complete len:820 (+),score=119.48 TRINITY_DN2130_c0_g2_i1:72-2531(+)
MAGPDIKPLELPSLSPTEEWLGDVPSPANNMPSPASKGTAEASPNKWHPPSFYCPISKQCMHDPVVLCDGHSYERRHIERWLGSRNTSPVSGLELPQKDLFANHALRNAIEEYFQQVFCAHRRAIRRQIKTPRDQGLDSVDLGSNQPLLRTMDALVQCSMLMNAELSLEQVLSKIMGEAKKLVGAEVASVFLVDTQRQELYSTVNSTGGELRIPINAGIAGHVASTGEPVIIHDTYSDKRSFCKRVDRKTGFKTRGMICVPLKVRKLGVIGVVQLINKISRGVLSEAKPASTEMLAEEPFLETFTEEDLQFLQVFASQVSTAVANGGEFEELLLQPASIRENPSTTQLLASAPAASGSKENDASTLKQKEQVNAPAMKMKSGKNNVLCIHESDSADSAPEEEPVQLPLLDLDARALDLLDEAFESWQFDAFRLAAVTQNRPLSTLSAYLFEELGIVDHFGFDRIKLHLFLQRLERGYDDDVAYHNRAHAASVLHMMHAYLEHGGLASLVVGAVSDGTSVDKSGKLERLACLLAAAVHDYEHRGVNNDFLVKTNDKRAVFYNDQSVNENHHVASAFALLRRPELNFLEVLPEADYRHLRKLVIELVLSTDMAMHNSILKSFTDMLDTKVSSQQDAEADELPKSRTDFKPSCANDAFLLLKIAIKCADLGHLALDWKTHTKWVKRLEDEFFSQGDQEKHAGLPVSFLMDRSKTGVSDSQTGFMDFVVLPLFRSLANAAPLSAPALKVVEDNRELWCAIEQAQKDNPGTSVSFYDQPDILEACVTTSGELGSPRRLSKRSGRTRQSAAFWAKVRVRTPSPRA